MGDLFKDKVVLVTGSGQGVGRAIALAFAAEGAKVVTNNRKPGGTRLVSMTEEEYNSLDPETKKKFDDLYAGITGDAETTAQTIRERGGEAFPIYADISKMDEAERMVKQVVDTYGTIHILINVAGAFGGGPLTEISEELWDRVNNIKPKGYFNVMKFAIPHMVKQKWGRILNCTSKAFMGDIVKFAQYSTANAGVVGLTQAAACEFFHEGITVNAFSPHARTRAAYEREFVPKKPGEEDKRAIPGMRPFPSSAQTPDPEAVPPFLMYLCTDHCKHITGTVFSISGNEIFLHNYPVVRNTLKKYGKDSKDYWTVDELIAEAPRSLLRDYVNILHVQ
jgi:3-oxoacyl-[acyl-carrier protein] reductase